MLGNRLIVALWGTLKQRVCCPRTNSQPQKQWDNTRVVLSTLCLWWLVSRQQIDSADVMNELMWVRGEEVTTRVAVKALLPGLHKNFYRKMVIWLKETNGKIGQFTKQKFVLSTGIWRKPLFLPFKAQNLEIKLYFILTTWQNFKWFYMSSMAWVYTRTYPAEKNANNYKHSEKHFIKIKGCVTQHFFFWDICLGIYKWGHSLFQ